MVRWRETGGPAVEEPGVKGFGSELIERHVGYELDGEVDLRFAPAGLEVTFVIPMAGELLEAPPEA